MSHALGSVPWCLKFTHLKLGPNAAWLLLRDLPILSFGHVVRKQSFLNGRFWPFFWSDSPIWAGNRGASTVDWSFFEPLTNDRFLRLGSGLVFYSVSAIPGVPFQSIQPHQSGWIPRESEAQNQTMTLAWVIERYGELRHIQKTDPAKSNFVSKKLQSIVSRLDDTVTLYKPCQVESLIGCTV